MSDRLERLALRSADGTLSRRDVVARGLLGALALSGLGRALLAEDALAGALAPCQSLKGCLDKKEKFWFKVFDDCTATRPGGVINHECWDILTEGLHQSQQYCFTQCPPPKGGKKIKAPTQTPKSTPPPPFQEGVERAADECANCVLVGGMCCYGSSTQFAANASLCVCAHPQYSCRVYGCG